MYDVTTAVESREVALVAKFEWYDPDRRSFHLCTLQQNPTSTTTATTRRTTTATHASPALVFLRIHHLQYQIQAYTSLDLYCIALVARLFTTMLLLPLKPCVRYDLMEALSKWLDSDTQQVTFAPNNPLQWVVPKPTFSSLACRNELMRLQSLRNSMGETLLKPLSHRAALEENALDDAQEYHAVLLEFEKKGFPTIDDNHNGVALPWRGAFDFENIEKHGTLVWERAAIQFNIAAMYTRLAYDCSVNDRESCKQGVAYCQNAATVLSFLRELVQSQSFSTVDLSVAMVTFWQKLCMAQAQSFVYRMAALNSDDTKHSTLSLLSQSAFFLFNEALQAAQDTRLQSEITGQANEWAIYCKCASMLAGAKAEYHQAVVHRLEHKYGKEIARLRICNEKLQACMDFYKSIKDESQKGIAEYLIRECKAIPPVVVDRLKEVERDNNTIYREEIPTNLQELPSKQLAKTTGSLPPAMIETKHRMFVNVK
jgi:BRO1-like domain